MTKSFQYWPIFLAIGIGVGVYFGRNNGELAYSIVIGAIVGVSIGIIADQARRVNKSVEQGKQKEKEDNVMPKF